MTAPKLQPWQLAIVTRLVEEARTRKKTDAVRRVTHEGKPYLVGIDLATAGSSDKSVATVARIEGKKITFIVADEIAYWPKISP